ncbi:MAG: GTPase ObgE [Clostridia bacterium]|nr:GTPase ObgE [Clostridia bacterium]
MFIDKVEISIKAGDGGDGIVSFLREKYVPNGGPDGGNGGNGGSIIFEATRNKNTLIDFKYVKKFEATAGEKGGSHLCSGKNGKDVIIQVPCGTIIKDAETNEILADMYADGDQYVVLQGGKGGRGNDFFKTSTRQAPHFSQLGEKTKFYKVKLELKTIADVALVGKPNVGKSTLLSVISNAKPKIADYNFTTLSPNLGVVKYYDDSFIVADIPGLIEGASEGAGLGHDFLAHIERTRLIVHVIDASGYYGNNPIEDYKIINKELKSYNKHLSTLPQIVALTKVDLLPQDSTVVEDFKKKVKNVEVIPICSITKQNINNLLKSINEKLKTLPIPEPLKIEKKELHIQDITTVVIEKISDDTYRISGGYVDNLQRGIVFSDPQSQSYFQHRLEKDGIIEQIRANGAVDGDTIIFGDQQFELVD